MGRKKKHDYWAQVTKVEVVEENGKVKENWKCKRCGRVFAGGVARIRPHVDKIPGKGIEICTVSSNPQEAMNAANSLQVENASQPIDTNIGGSINHQDNVEPNYLEQGLLHNASENNNVEAFQEEINHLRQIIFDLQRDEDGIKRQLQWLESRGKKCKRRRVDNWLNDLEGFKRRAGHMIQSQLLSGIEKFTKEVERHNRFKPLVLSNEIVGENFEENLDKVLKLLKDDQVFIIGIYGRGGVGKTLLASQVENGIKRNGTFTDVFWVTVTLNFSISKLQCDIAKKIGVKLDDEDDERTRGVNLSSALETKENSILVLDDVWKFIDLQKVGVNGIKVILITRLKHVCQQMNCSPNSMIEIKCLNCNRDWELFLVKLGHQGIPVKLSSEVTKIARSVVEICAGLPLAINVMARTLKGKLDDVDWWKHTLNKLNKGEMGQEMEEEVLKVLKLSYDNLVDEDMQNCFLYCALLPCITPDDLVMKLVDKGLINGMGSLEEIFAEGRTILGKLKDHSFFVTDYCIEYLSPESVLMSYLACYIMKSSHRYAMFKYYEKGLPCLQEWTADLEMVSLMSSTVEEIPGDMSPCCPKLSTLILCKCSISSIPEHFFEHMNALAVLDLSGNNRLKALPNSISILKSLVSLVLRGCKSLEYVPPLGDLQALSRLDISGCSLKEVPQGLETLIRLKWLDLSDNHNLTWVSGSLISGMTNMQYLDLGNTCIKITAQDVQGMKMLEYFGGHFFKWDNYNQFVRQFLINGFRLKHFLITLGNDQNYFYYWCRPLKSKIVVITDCEEFGHLPLPRAFEELRILGNDQWTCLCNGLSSEGTFSSWKIDIASCGELKSWFCSADPCLSCESLSHHYSTLESINISECHSMTEIFANAPQPFSGAFSCLKHIKIYSCNAIENLLTAEIVPELQNLETIAVTKCNSMKELFAGSNNDEDDGSIIKLPKLTKLKLHGLTELKMVCKGIIVCGSSMPSDILEIRYCPKLERIPIVQRCTD